MEAIPPPDIKSASDIAKSASGYSIPLLEAKNAGQCTPRTATPIVQARKKAATRVSKPKKSRTPPINSESAAAPIQSHDGLIKE